MQNIENRKKRYSIFMAIATVSILSVTTRGLSFLFKIYLSRTHGAEAVGLYQISISVFFAFVSITASGLPLIISRKIAKSTQKNTANASIVSSAIVIGLLICLVIILIFLLFPSLFNLLFSDRRTIPLFKLMLPALFSTTVYCVIRGWFLGKKQFVFFGFTELLEELLRILFTVSLSSGIIFNFMGAHAIAIAFLISDIVSAICLILMYFLKGGRFARPNMIKEITVASVTPTAMHMFGSIISSMVAIIIPARLILIGMSTSEATAEFGRVSGMAIPLLMAPLSLIGSISIVLIPEIASDSMNMNTKKLCSKIDKALSATILISGLFFTVYLPYGTEIGRIVYNDSYAGAYLSYSAILMFPLAINQLTSTILHSLDREKKAFFNFFVGSIFMVILIFLLPQYIGIYTVAVSTGTCYLITSVLNLIKLKKILAIKYTFLKSTLFIILFVIPTTFISVWLKNISSFYFPNLISTLFCMVLTVILYLLFIWVFDIADITSFVFIFKSKPSMQKKTPL